MHRHHPFGERAERAFLHMAGKFGGRGGGFG
ncbi:MAG: PadR family transcriptional regulator, partial [Mesorhizobium sp.]